MPLVSPHSRCIALTPCSVRAMSSTSSSPSIDLDLDVRDAQDACVVMEAVRLGILPLWTRRLNPEERQSIQPGNIYVWEEAQEKGGLERWTDGRRYIIIFFSLERIP